MWPVGYQCQWREIDNQDLLQICIFSKTKRKMKKDILPDAQAKNLKSSLILFFLPYHMSYPKHQPTPTSAHSNFQLHPEASQRHFCLYSFHPHSNHYLSTGKFKSPPWVPCFRFWFPLFYFPQHIERAFFY